MSCRSSAPYLQMAHEVKSKENDMGNSAHVVFFLAKLIGI